MVDAYAAMIFVAAEHQLAVVPDLPGIFAAQPAARPGASGGVFGVGKGGDFLEAIAGAGVALLMSTMPYSSAVMNSLHSTLPDLPYVAERSIFFSGKHSGKAFSLGVVKRSDNIPVHEKPKMPWEIDLFIELA